MAEPTTQAEAIAYLKAKAAQTETLESLREAEAVAQAEKNAVEATTE